jgi:DNA-binding NarL/FixJ family response regulator
MERTANLEAGRAAVVERRWQNAFDLLAAADAEKPLEIDDLELLGRSAQMLGRDEVALPLLIRGYEMARASGDLDRAALLAFWHGYRLASLGQVAQAGAWLARSEELLQKLDRDSVVRGYLNLPRVRASLAAQDFARAATLAREACAIGTRFGNTDLCALAAELEGRALLLMGEVQRGLSRFDEAMLTATEKGSTELVRGLVYCSVIAGCQMVFAVDHAREWTAVLGKWSDTQPQMAFSGTCRVHRAEIMQIGGAWKDALAEIEKLPIGPRAGGINAAAAAYQEGEIHRARGEYADAESAYVRVAEAGGDTQPGLALLRLSQGRIEDATGGIRRVLAANTSPLRRARYLPAAVEILLATAKPEEATEACKELAAIAASYATPVLQAVAAHAEGAIALKEGDAGKALSCFNAAYATWHRLEAPYLAARIRVDIADAYAALGDADGSRLEREAARKVFTALGAQPALDALTDNAPELLSRRERQVLEMAAAGLTNKQIAASLKLSRRTVDRHMSNILNKLAVPSRAAATAYAYEHGLVGGQRQAG